RFDSGFRHTFLFIFSILCFSIRSLSVQDIVLLRAMLYAPISGSDFFSLSRPNEQSMICVGNYSFPVPQSFVVLYNYFPGSDCLLARSFDEKQLNKKLHRLGEYAGIDETVTPSTFRLFAQSVWSALLINDRTKVYLPRR